MLSTNLLFHPKYKGIFHFNRIRQGEGDDILMNYMSNLNEISYTAQIFWQLKYFHKNESGKTTGDQSNVSKKKQQNTRRIRNSLIWKKSKKLQTEGYFAKAFSLIQKWVCFYVLYVKCTHEKRARQ
jgi:hypothetical protein